MVDQHHTLLQGMDRVCMAAEKHAAGLESQLDKLHQEYVDRSTTSKSGKQISSGWAPLTMCKPLSANFNMQESR